MPISLSTISSGATVDADVLKARVASIERYVNEQIAVGDRTTSWLDSIHVFSPDFQYAGGKGPRVIMPGGETAWSVRPIDRSQAALFYYGNQTNYVPVPGLCRTLCYPEVPTSTFRVTMYASFYAFEYGGEGAAPGGARTEAATCANFQFFLDGTGIAATRRKIGPSSNTSTAVAGNFSGQIYARKQVTMFNVEAGGNFASAGVHHVDVRCQPTAPAGANEWKHIFVVHGGLLVRHRVR